jgi:hypothetical protein
MSVNVKFKVIAFYRGMRECRPIRDSVLERLTPHYRVGLLNVAAEAASDYWGLGIGYSPKVRRPLVIAAFSIRKNTF